MTARREYDDTRRARASCERVRFYVHGDADERSPSVFLCACCGCFLPRDHLLAGCEFARGRSDAELVEHGLAAMRGDTVPAQVVAFAPDPERAARECRDYRRKRYYRPAHARTVWNTRA